MTDDGEAALTPNESFYRLFNQRFKDISANLDNLADPSLVGADRNTKLNDCFADIASLSEAVKDASTYIPPYDQRSYSNSLKELSARLDKVKSAHTPKSKFSFKKGGSALGRSKVVTSEVKTVPSSSQSQARTSASTAAEPQGAGHNKIVLTATKPSVVRLPTDVSGPLPNIHLENISGCVVDLSVSPTTGERIVVPSMTLNNLSRSVILLPTIEGPVHLTGLRDCLVGIRSCAQYRMHDCNRVRVFMHCSSNPIVENVMDVGFAPFPVVLRGNDGADDVSKGSANLYDKVQDFLWLKSTPSPHWHVISPQDQEVANDSGWSLLSRVDDLDSDAVQGLVVTMLQKTGVAARG